MENNKSNPQKNFDIGKKLEEIARRFVLKNQTTKNDDKVSYVCKFCDKSFLKNQYLNHHIFAIHTQFDQRGSYTMLLRRS